MKRLLLFSAICLSVFISPASAEKRSEYFRIRIPAYGEFRKQYNPLYRIGALANYWNLNIYDVLMENPSPAYIDGPYYQNLKASALGRRIRLDPDAETASPVFSRLAWGVAESFIWTHALHENAFDAYADPSLTMAERCRMVEEATDRYLENPRALSPVPVSMEMMHRLPYHGVFACRYPKMMGLIWAGHWYHGGVYEGLIAVSCSRKAREQLICEVEAEFEQKVLNPPSEHPHFTHIAPEFTRLHPRAANIFSNMHMLHDMVADILADDRIKDKRRAIFEARDMMLAGRVRAMPAGGMDHAH